MTKGRIQLGAVSIAVVLQGVVLLPTARANSLDLTSGGSGSINGAQFFAADQRSTGSGVINSFVRINSNNAQEDGYNADARPVMPDVNTSGTFTRDITLTSVPIVNLGGIGYYEFLLDINQNGSDPLLSLDKLQIYTRGTALGTADTLAALTGSGATLRYNLDGSPAGDSEILLNYNLNTGSGSGDMFAFIPTSLFGSRSDYVYLYSQFGGKGGAYINNDGFEEWATEEKPDDTTTVPDGGATLALLGMALVGVEVMRRKFRA